MRKFEIQPIIYGRSVLPESMAFQNGSENKSRPIVFMIYLIRTKDRLILADTGSETMPGFDMKNYIGPIKALKQMNISPKDITDVIITHAHHDHIGCVNYFCNAEIYIQKDEYEIGKEYFADDQNIHTFEQEIEIYPGIKAIRIGGHSVGSCIVEIRDEKEIYILAGDECYLKECLDKKIPTGCSCCLEKSREFLEKYGNGGYTVLLFHDELQ